MRDYALGKLGGKRVDRITTADVLAVLTPIWNDKRETARRVRQRIRRRYEVGRLPKTIVKTIRLATPLEPPSPRTDTSGNINGPCPTLRLPRPWSGFGQPERIGRLCVPWNS